MFHTRGLLFKSVQFGRDNFTLFAFCCDIVTACNLQEIHKIMLKIKGFF